MKDLSFALFWCLIWGEGKQPKKQSILSHLRTRLLQGIEIDSIIDSVTQLEEFTEFQDILTEVRQLEQLENFPETSEELVKLTESIANIWDRKIGLVYGGATKIKQYVFESAKLPEIRGASAILDRINLIDLPAFFGEVASEEGNKVIINKESLIDWLDESFPDLKEALIPQLIIYSTGGNILAFCPAYFVNDLANAIEKRYTEETLTANSCAVGSTFKLLETRLGLLPDTVNEKTNWFANWYLPNKNNDLVTAYFGKPEQEECDIEFFQNRKSFNELAGKLATLFNQRRSGNDAPNRPSRRYPPIFETHPYLQRNSSDSQSAIAQITEFPQQPWISESSARKLWMGQLTKRIETKNRLQQIYRENIAPEDDLAWQPREIKSWIEKFTDYLGNSEYRDSYYKPSENTNIPVDKVEQARSLKEIGNAGNGYVGYIYADGNNMGGYIQKIKTPQEYQNFSRDIFTATEKSVYLAIAEHLQSHKITNINDSDNPNRNGVWIHPFEIITIGGDDVMLIVPANKALQVAQTLSEQFEKILLKNTPITDTEIIEDYSCQQNQTQKQIEETHRHNLEDNVTQAQCKLSMSAGVLIAAMNTPVYYAENLTGQLLKLAKKKAKRLKKDFAYYGGTIDFLVLKSVTMISSDIEKFRQEGLIKQP